MKVEESPKEDVSCPQPTLNSIELVIQCDDGYNNEDNEEDNDEDNDDGDGETMFLKMRVMKTMGMTMRMTRMV